MAPELRKRNVDPLSDPDYTLIVRAQDLGGKSNTALSGNTRVQIVVLENLWVNPGPLVVMEHLAVVYPLVIAKVSPNTPAGSSDCRMTTFPSTRFNPTIRKPSTP